MTQHTLALACTALLAVALAGCTGTEPPAQPTTGAVASIEDPAAVPAAVPVESKVSATDQKGFAGTFANASTTVTLAADGGARVDGDPASFEGTWTAEVGGARVRVDPHAKSEADRLYTVKDSDRLQPITADGVPMPATQELHRTDAAH